MKLLRNILSSLAILFAVAPLYAQVGSVEVNGARAFNFAYGANAYKGQSAPAPLRVDIGNSATGAGTITLAFGNIYTTDGVVFMPLSTTAKITVGSGANAESVTPTAVSCNSPKVLDTCQVTATFANLHGVGDLVSSASGGLSEAILYQGAAGGGAVWIDRAWISLGLTTAYITGTALGYTTVPIIQNIGTATGAAFSYRATGTYPATTAYAVTAISWY